MNFVLKGYKEFFSEIRRVEKASNKFVAFVALVTGLMFTGGGLMYVLVAFLGGFDDEY